jgi:hypothetical protein
MSINRKPSKHVEHPTPTTTSMTDMSIRFWRFHDDTCMVDYLNDRGEIVKFVVKKASTKSNIACVMDSNNKWTKWDFKKLSLDLNGVTQKGGSEWCAGKFKGAKVVIGNKSY